DRYSRGTLSGCFAKRSTGLLRTDRKHRISRSRTRDVALHLCDETRSYGQRSIEAVAIKRNRRDPREALTPRHRQAGRDFRNTLRSLAFEANLSVSPGGWSL